MMTLSRRLICATSLLGVLAGCATTQIDPVVQKLVTEGNAIDAGLSTALSKMTTISAATRTQLQAYINEIAAAAAAVGQVSAATAAQLPIGKIMSYVAGFAALVPALGLPASIVSIVSAILTAAQVLIPIMAAEVGLSGATPIVATMTEDQAIAILTAKR